MMPLIEGEGSFLNLLTSQPLFRKDGIFSSPDVYLYEGRMTLFKTLTSQPLRLTLANKKMCKK